jgi:hypothetical protein
MYARVTSVIMQAMESSLKKVKAPIPPQALSGVQPRIQIVSFLSLYQERCRTEISHQVQTECDGQCIEAYTFYGEDDDSSDEEMANNKCVGDTSLGASEFHPRLMSDTATRRKLKARESFTVHFRFFCDYADQ